MKLLLRIEDFLTDMQMRVSVNGAYSDWANVTKRCAKGLSVGTTLDPAIRK